MVRKGQRHLIDGIAGLLVYGLFAVCILAVLLSGAKVYSRIVNRDNDVYESRTGVQYIATKLRQAELPSSVSITKENGLNVLRIREEDGDEECYACIYCYEGYLRELILESGVDFYGDAGEKLIPAESADFEIDDGMLRITVTDRSGTQRELLFSLGKGDAA